MRIIPLIVLILLVFSCKKDKTIPYPSSDLSCAFSNLYFSADTSYAYNLFYPVKNGNTWNYETVKYFHDTLDAGYHTTYSPTITGICFLADTVWELNSNSEQVYGKRGNQLFTLGTSSSGCRVPVPEFFIPAPGDTILYSNTPYGITEMKCYTSAETVVTPSGTYTNCIVSEGSTPDYLYKRYYASGIGCVKSITSYPFSYTCYERVLVSYNIH